MMNLIYKKILGKYKRLAKTIDFSERGSKKEQAREEYRTMMATRPFIYRAIKEDYGIYSFVPKV